MDFQQQVTEAMDRPTPVYRKPVIVLAIMGFLAIAIGGLWLSQRAINAILTHGTARLAEKYDATAENLRKYELLSSTLSGEIEQLRDENTELTRRIGILEIQVTEAQKQAGKAKGIAEQLSDANTELDLAEAKIKSLTAELEALRQAAQPGSRSVAMNPR